MDLFAYLNSNSLAIENSLNSLPFASQSSGDHSAVLKQLRVTFQAEEEYFFNPLKQDLESYDDIFQSIEEHRLMLKMFDRLQLSTDANTFAARAKLLADVFTRHRDREDRVLFDNAKESLDDEEIRTIYFRTVYHFERCFSVPSFPAPFLVKLPNSQIENS